MADGYLGDKFTVPPTQEGEAQNTDTGATVPATETQPTTADAGTAPAVETKPDTFIEDFNKRYSTSFKADDELKTVLGLQTKMTEYESKAKLADDYAKEIGEYKKQIENYKDNNNSEFLSKPLIRKAYVADQLLAKYPDKDPFVLQEIAMVDVDKMGDIDVLVKSQKINHPRLSESDIKAVLYKKHGIDPDTKPDEWDSIARTEVAMDAETARANIKALTNGIELPKTVTKEERDQAQQLTMQQRVKATEPLKTTFTTFDKFKKGDFEYDVPSEFKSRLGDTFDAMFLKDGLEPTPENLQTAVELRDAQFLYQHFDKILEVAVKKGQTEIQKKLDEALNNTKLPNTATATDEGDQTSTLPGLAKFLQDN